MRARGLCFEKKNRRNQQGILSYWQPDLITTQNSCRPIYGVGLPWLTARPWLELGPSLGLCIYEAQPSTNWIDTSITRKWSFCHYERWVSLFCHPAKEIRCFVIIKPNTAARMSFDRFIIKFNHSFILFVLSFLFYPSSFLPRSRRDRPVGKKNAVVVS